MTQNKDSNRKEQLNENLYRDHFEDMDNLKRIIYQSEQTYVKSNDQRIKAISLRTIKTAKKYLEELEIEIKEMTKEYEGSKIKLKSLI